MKTAGFNAVADYTRIGIDILWTLTQFPRWILLSPDPAAIAASSGTEFGINVATTDDPAGDDYVCAKLADLNVSHVRLAWSHASPHGPMQRLLERLLQEGYDVMVALVPDPADARLLADDTASQHRWRTQVKQFLSAYGDRAAVVEIGNASNRKKWSGYSPRSYLTAWQIAAEEAKSANINLAGPNVSDFEPFFNAFYLRGMRRAGLMPSIQTTNLFVERTIEPEAYDARAMSRYLSRGVRLNLTKKIKILALLAKRLGIADTYCTYTCWTNKRLSRWTVYPERKRADYLVRYLVIAHASNRLERVYWGPLIDARDGLINCGGEGYPKVDNVANYARVRGNISEFRVNESYAAFKFVTSLLHDSACEQAVSNLTGLGHYVFVDEDFEHHVMFARDRAAYDVRDLYPADMAMQRAHDIFGNRLSPATFQGVVTERPVILKWSKDEQPPRPDRAAVQNLPAIGGSNAVHGLDMHRYPVAVRNDTWQGVVGLDCSLGREAAETLTPGHLHDLEPLHILRDKRNRLWTVASPLDSSLVTVKLNRATGARRLSYLFSSSKGQRHWNNATEMGRRGIPTPRPLAYFERHGFAGVRENYYLCEFTPDAFSTRDVFTAFKQGADSYRGIAKDAWIETVAQFVAMMHQRGMIHRDLSSGNLLITMQNGKPDIQVIDIGRAVFSKRQGAATDLKRICYKLGWADREAFVDEYKKALPDADTRFWRLSLRSYDAKQTLKRVLKGRGLRKKLRQKRTA